MKKELLFSALFFFILFFYACSHEKEQKVNHLSDDGIASVVKDYPSGKTE
ncbi:MAG: hypothetical protein LLF81_04910 [Porphyromonadaceae bacterium]|nr:hypothetical protein [Porphyromonadaceae bacterium]